MDLDHVTHRGKPGLPAMLDSIVRRPIDRFSSTAPQSVQIERTEAL